MQLILQQPWTSIGSDGSAVNPDGPTGRTHPHPRYYGTFPRVLGRYVRELKTITLPDAVKKMTSMNADKIGIKDAGRLREGLAPTSRFSIPLASSIGRRSSNRTSFRSGSST
jgi:N-acyl-D-aspartate/D-glutamate deacylase